ncbi:MAG: DUF6600 domain-containing protein [Verrucomicrobiota bacterium]|mgnify:CR=1 FL=1|nr:DUF6600 domain-containing protein [Verrucomicrobiota bacterium]
MYRLFILTSFLALCSLRAAVAPYTDTPRVDFDVAYTFLLKHGSWEPHKTYRYAFVPAAAPGWQPFRDGRWLYSDDGWLWQGKEPWSWLTDHYGFWRNEDSRWIWVPRSRWFAAPVVWQKKGESIAWKAVRFNKLGEIVDEADEVAKTEGWNLSTLTQLKSDITPSNIQPSSEIEAFLPESETCYHIFTSYRDIERSGPDPFDLFGEKFLASNLFFLPTLDAKPPEGALPNKLYINKVEFIQEEDGFFTRIKILRDGKAAKPNIKALLNGGTLDDAPSGSSATVNKLNKPLDAEITTSKPTQSKKTKDPASTK